MRPAMPALLTSCPLAGRLAVRPWATGKRLRAAALLGLLLLLLWQWLPLVSQWVARQAVAQQGGWVQVCSTSGLAWVVAQAPQTGPTADTPPTTGLSNTLPAWAGGCEGCLMHITLLALPSGNLAHVHAPGAMAGGATPWPLLVVRWRPHFWRTAPRGPPALA